VAGALCLAVKGKLDSADDLDRLCAAAGVVAKRLVGEAQEGTVTASAGAQ
jgi:hypothetical protein